MAGPSEDEQNPTTGWGSKQIKGMLRQLGIHPDNGKAMAAVVRMDMGARAGDKKEVTSAAADLAKIFLENDPVATSDPSAPISYEPGAEPFVPSEPNDPLPFSSYALDKNTPPGKLAESILRYFVKLDKASREKTKTRTMHVKDQPAPNGAGFLAKVRDKNGLRAVKNILLEIAIARRDGVMTEAMEKGERVLTTLRRNETVAEETTLQEILDYCSTLKIPDNDNVKGIAKYIMDEAQCREFYEAYMQLAEMAEREGEAVALRKGAALMKTLTREEALIAGTPTTALLEFGRILLTERRSTAEEDEEPEDDHTAEPMDTTRPNPRLPPDALWGNLKYKNRIAMMETEFQNENRPKVMYKMALELKDFCRKEMKRSGLGDGKKIRAKAILKHDWGRRRPKKVIAAEKQAANEQLQAAANENMLGFLKAALRKVNWEGFCQVYEFPHEMVKDIRSLGNWILMNSIDDSTARSKAQKFVVERKKGNPKFKMQNGDHLLGAILDAAIAANKGKTLRRTPLPLNRAMALLEDVAPH